jgi:uncharacterized protein (TIGR03000 family)
MTLRTLTLAVLLAAMAGLVTGQTPKAEKTEKSAAAKVKTLIKVTVPQDDAELKIDGQVMKAQGEKREYDTPDLEAGMEYSYEFTAKWMPNNYTTITRKKSVKFKAGEPLTVDLTKEDPTDKIFIRYVPTPDDIVKKMLELAKVSKEDTVYDLGCGDGRLVVAAVKAGAKKGVGIDLDPERVKESKANVEKAGVKDKVEIRQGDILEMKDLGEANVVLMYLSDELGKLFQPKLMKDLKPGTRIVCHRFTIGDWKPDQTITVKGEDGDDYVLHIWTVKGK